MLLEGFIKYLQYEKRYSKHTIIAYQKDITQYLDFLQQHSINFEEASHKQVRFWVVSMMDDELEAKSVNRKISSIRSFYKHLLKEGVVSSNPVSKIVSPKVSKRLPVFVADDKLNYLLDEVDFGEGFVGSRNKLVVELLFATGIRLNELLLLKTQDVAISSKAIKVLGKRNKERIVPLNSSVFNLISDYLDLRDKREFAFKTDTLLLTNNGRSAYPKLVYRIVNKYLSIISTQTKKSPHILRHSFATSLLNKGADINAIKDLLGHANLAATQVYTHNSIERLKSIYKQAHPKA